MSKIYIIKIQDSNSELIQQYVRRTGVKIHKKGLNENLKLSFLPKYLVKWSDIMT